MLHELIGIENNKIDLNDKKKVERNEIISDELKVQIEFIKNFILFKIFLLLITLR